MILQVKEVSKNYTGHVALDNVSIDVPEGSVYGLLGPNGAGKTTLIRIINRITMPDSGEVLLNGKLLTAEDIYRIGYLPEERGLYKKMKVGEQMLFLAQLKGLTKQEALKRIKPWIDKFEIASWWNKKIEELSKGMAQKIQFIITVIHQPKLLIFDEPFSGFDPLNANIIKTEIMNLRDNGTTIILSTHNMNSVEEICDNLTLINRSRNILTGKVSDIKKENCSGDYRIDFIGNIDTLLHRLSYLTDIKVLDNKSELQSIELNLSTNKKEIISLINEQVDIYNVTEKLPSMNDIFIKVVNMNN